MNPNSAHAQRFTRRQRLTVPREFSHVMAKARRSADRLFTVLARENALAHPRLGLTISRKAARRAVDRNLIRRIARETFRQCGHRASVDVIVFARQATVKESRAGLRRSLERHFERLMSEQAA